MTAPKVILVVRLSAMGDLVMASGFAQAMRVSYPKARLVWLVQDGFADVAAVLPAVDEVVVWPRRVWQRLFRARKWWALWREVTAFRATLSGLRADWAIDLQGLLKSGLMVHWSGAQRRVSLGGREGSRFLMTEVIDRGDGRPADQADMGTEYRVMAHALGCPDPLAAMPRLALPPESLARAQQWLQAARLQNRIVTTRRIVLIPFTTRPQKHWPEAYWTELIQGLSSDPTCELVLLGGPSDSDSARRLLANAPAVLNAVGQLSIQDSFSVLVSADAVIGVDTGLTHAAQALARPTVVIFGSTIPYQKRLHPTVEILWSARSCSPCGRRPTCSGRFDCQRDITPAMVRSALARAHA
jgi:heptosyltransferase-1